MSLISIPIEILYLVADNLHPRDHSAVTLANRHLAFTLQPVLLSRIRTLPMLDSAYALLALHWAAASANLPALRHLLETIPRITATDTVPGTMSLRTYTTPGPCPPTAWSWICTRGASLHLSHSGDSQPFWNWSRQGLTSAEYAIITHHNALLRLSFGTFTTEGHAQRIVRYAAQRGNLRSLEMALVLLREKFGDDAWETTRDNALSIVGRSRGGMSFFFQPREGVDARDGDGRTMLHRVVRGMLLGQGNADKSHPNYVRQLLLRGADVDAIDGEGVTALHVAAGMVHLEVVEVLILGGADVDSRDADGSSPLHRVLRARGIGRWELVELLRVHGADFMATDAAGVTVMELMDSARALRSSARLRGL